MKFGIVWELNSKKKTQYKLQKKKQAFPLVATLPLQAQNIRGANRSTSNRQVLQIDMNFHPPRQDVQSNKPTSFLWFHKVVAKFVFGETLGVQPLP